MDFQNILDDPELGSILRLVAALVFSGAIGWEREKIGKAAGLRTHMLVGIGAASFLILGELMARGFNAAGLDVELDPLRIVQAVVIGIGFLGAGTIFVLHGENRVIGLTTAASIWATAGVGMLAGLGSFLVATVATVLIVGILHFPILVSGSKGKESKK